MSGLIIPVLALIVGAIWIALTIHIMRRRNR